MSKNNGKNNREREIKGFTILEYHSDNTNSRRISYKLTFFNLNEQNKIRAFLCPVSYNIMAV